MQTITPHDLLVLGLDLGRAITLVRFDIIHRRNELRGSRPTKPIKSIELNELGYLNVISADSDGNVVLEFSGTPEVDRKVLATAINTHGVTGDAKVTIQGDRIRIACNIFR